MITEPQLNVPSALHIPLEYSKVKPNMGYVTDSTILEELSKYPVSWSYDLSNPLPLACQLEIGKSYQKTPSWKRFRTQHAGNHALLSRTREAQILHLLSPLDPRSAVKRWNFQGNALLMVDSDILDDDIVAACACAAGSYTKKGVSHRPVCKNTHACPRCCHLERADFESVALTAIKEQGLMDFLVTLSASPIPMGDPHQAHAIWRAQMDAWDAVCGDLGVVGGAYRYEFALSRVFLDETRGFLRDHFLIRPHIHLVVLSKNKLGREAGILLENSLKEKLHVVGQSSTCSVDIKPIKSGTLKTVLAYIRKPLGVISKDSAYSDMAKAIKVAFPDAPLHRRLAFLSLNKVCCDAIEYLRCCTRREFTRKDPQLEEAFKIPPRVTKAYGAFGILYGRGGQTRKNPKTKAPMTKEPVRK